MCISATTPRDGMDGVEVSPVEARARTEGLRARDRPLAAAAALPK
jgi:hypothetical protein